MRYLQIGLILGCAVLAAGCLPVTTKAPVGTTAGLSADPALIGTWKVIADTEKSATGDGGPGFVHFLVSKDGDEDGAQKGTMTALTVSTGKAGPPKAKGDWGVYAASAAILGGHHYLNVRPRLENGERSKDEEIGNIPLAYRFDARGRLSLYLINEDAAKAAIKAGKIEGAIGSGDLGDVSITAPAAKLDAFFASKDGAALFTEKLLTMKRVE